MLSVLRQQLQQIFRASQNHTRPQIWKQSLVLFLVHPVDMNCETSNTSRRFVSSLETRDEARMFSAGTSGQWRVASHRSCLHPGTVTSCPRCSGQWPPGPGTGLAPVSTLASGHDTAAGALHQGTSEGRHGPMVHAEQGAEVSPGCERPQHDCCDRGQKSSIDR